MTQKTQQLDRNLMQDALALSQAACYASMSAKEHREGSPQSSSMLGLTQKLVAMTIAALDAAILPEITPKEGEPTLQDYVDQAKAAVAAGQPVPDIVQDIPLPTPVEAPSTYTGPWPEPIPAPTPEVQEPEPAPAVETSVAPVPEEPAPLQ